MTTGCCRSENGCCRHTSRRWSDWRPYARLRATAARPLSWGPTLAEPGPAPRGVVPSADATSHTEWRPWRRLTHLPLLRLGASGGVGCRTRPLYPPAIRATDGSGGPGCCAASLCPETLKTRCFTDDLPQRTLGGRPVHGEAVTIAGVPCWGAHAARGMGNSQ